MLSCLGFCDIMTYFSKGMIIAKTIKKKYQLYGLTERI